MDNVVISRTNNNKQVDVWNGNIPTQLTKYSFHLPEVLLYMLVEFMCTQPAHLTDNAKGELP
jgi:hypothetical protein